MQKLDVDVAVIGSGTAGLNARRQVEKEGRSVVMIESGPYGTTCARAAGVDRGLVRLYAQRQGCRLIGAEMFGPRVEHMAHLLAWAVQDGMTVQHILRMPFYHPALEEGLRTGLRTLAAKLRVRGDCRCEDLSDAPGA